MRTSTTRAELRKFGYLMAGALTAFGALSLFLGRRNASLFLFSGAGLFLLCGLAFPAALGRIYTAWMGLAHLLAWINTRVILSIFFYLVITPMSLGMKLARRDALKRRIDRSCPSYWSARGAMKPAKQSYEHLY
jgi:hypothetical protein